MAISKEKKNEIIAQYARHEGDTGSVEVQVAVLTWEINHLNEHIKQHKKDQIKHRSVFKIGLYFLIKTPASLDLRVWFNL